jgi:transposase
MPLSAVVTGASGNERAQISTLFEKVRVYHGYGRPKHCPREIHADRGYDSKALKVFLRSKGIRPVIPRRTWKDRKQTSGPKVIPSKDRWKVERCFAWMQRKFRRLAIRWERKTKYWEGLVQLSIVMMWVDKLIAR